MSAPVTVMEPKIPPRRFRVANVTLRRRYSRFVGWMKLILPAVAAALLGLLVVWPRFAQQTARIQVGFSQSEAGHMDASSIRNPRYYGTDENNLPFTVTADVATQLDPQNTVVTLEKPVADLVRADGKTVVINADIGFYRQKDDTLDLMGHVDLYRDDGYELHTSSARVLIAQGNASGDEPVQGQGPSGTVTGDGFRMIDRGRVVTVTGHSKALLSVGPRKPG